MARIKHIAIRTGDVEKTAAFYKEAFGLKQVGLGQNGIYLTDGHLNIAVLKFQPGKNGEPLTARHRPRRFPGRRCRRHHHPNQRPRGQTTDRQNGSPSHRSISAAVVLRDQVRRAGRASDRRFQRGLGRSRLSWRRPVVRTIEKRLKVNLAVSASLVFRNSQLRT